MRRNDKEITDNSEIESILSRGRVIRVAFAHEEPYLLPFNYGFSDGKIYIHCAKEGKKLDIIRKDPRVFFEVTVDEGLKDGENACSTGFRYRCVLGKGMMEVVSDENEKISGLNLLMKQQAGMGSPVYDPEKLSRLEVLKISIVELSGKKSGY